ncbi:MAG: hypothetical protein JST00_43275 [Deltaproteobacteria bacterium]|nr:hypothetical protein [Deltaproteobacteria bacterium]
MRSFSLHVLFAVACLATFLSPMSVRADAEVPAPTQAQYGEENGMFSQIDPRTGAMTYSYAFDLPPARGLSGPTLALSYNSSVSQANVAYGWSLHVPTIERRPLSGLPRSNAAGDPVGGDRYVFDGQPLVKICVVGAACPEEPFTSGHPTWPGVWTYFRLQNEGLFARFYMSMNAERTTWRVVFKGGEMVEFGRPLEDLPTFDGLVPDVEQWTERWDGGITRWLPSIRRSLNHPNNRIVYRWQKLGTRGIAYLTDIWDTPPLAGAHSLSSFEHHTQLSWSLIDAPARGFSHAPPFRAPPDYRLDRVGVASKRPSGGGAREIYRLYSLAYAAPRGSRPGAGWTADSNLAPLWRQRFLRQITQTGHCEGNEEDGAGQIPSAVQCATLPAVSFDYEPALPTPFDVYAPAVEGGPPNLVAESKVLPAPMNAAVIDFDRDGRPDIVQGWPERCEAGKKIEIRAISGSLVVVCVDNLHPEDDYIVRNARPILGYRNVGPTIAAPAGQVVRYTCMDAGPLLDPISLATGQSQVLKPGFFASTGNTTLGAFGSGVAVWGINGYLPILARFQESAPGGAEPAASGCHLDSSFDPAAFHPSWRWQTAAVEPWQKLAPRTNHISETPEWNVDIDGDGLPDRLERAAGPTLGPYARATPQFTRRYAGKETHPTPSGPAGSGPALVPFSWSASSFPISIVPIDPKEVWDPAPNAFNRHRVYYTDIDGDGLPDAVSVDYLSAAKKVRVRPGDGRGNFRCGPSDPQPCVTESIDGAFLASYYELDIVAPFMPWDLPAGSVSSLKPWFFEMADVTGDGLSDIVRVVPDALNSPRSRVEVWVNKDGHHFECVGAPSAPCLAGYFNQGASLESRLTFADMDSDGVNDIVFLTEKGAFVGRFNARPSLGPSGARAVRPGQLIRISNGRGARTEVTYKTVQELELEAAAAGTPWAHRSPVVESVVTELRTHNQDPGGPTKPAPFAIDRYQRFSYREPGYDNWARRFVGFRKVAVRNGFEQAITETTYWLGPCENEAMPPENQPVFCPGTSDDESPSYLPSYRAWVGKPMRIDRYVPATSGQAPARHLWSRTFEYEEPSLLFSPGPGATDTDRHVSFAYAKRVETHLYFTDQPTSAGYSYATLYGGDDIELAPAQSGHKILATTIKLDRNGNTVEQTSLGEELADITLVTQASDNAFGGAPEITCDRNWNCQPIYQFVFSHVGGGTQTVHRQTRLTYDPATADLRKVEALLDTTQSVTRFHSGGGDFSAAPPGAATSGWKVQAELDYDANGVLTFAKGPGDAATPRRSCVRTLPDDAYGHFPRRVVAYTESCGTGPSLVTEASFDRHFGVPVTTTAPDLSVSMIVLDPFGRIQEAYAPTSDGLIGATDLVGDATYSDFGPAPSAESRRYTSTFTSIRSIQIGNALGEPVMGFQQGDGSNWTVGGWTERDASGRAVLTRRPFGVASGALASALAGQSVPTPLYGRFESVPDAFGRILTVKENGAPILERTPTPLAIEVRDQEQLPGGSHTGAFTRVETNGRGQVVHVAHHGDGSVIETYNFLDGIGQPYIIFRTGPGAPDYARSLVWDSLGRIVENSEPNSMDRVTGRTIRYAYDDANRLAGTSDGRGCGVDFYYDALGRTTGENYSPCASTQQAYTAYNPGAVPNGLEVEQVYDTYDPAQVNPEPGFADNAALAAGRMTARRDRGAETHFNHDARGFVRRVSRRVTKPLSQQAPGADPYAAHWFRSRADFDFAGRLASRTTGADDPELLAAGVGAETYAYSSRGLLTSVATAPRSIINSIGYTAEGLLANMTYGDLAATRLENTYDEPRRRLSRSRVFRFSQTLWGGPSGSNYSKPNETTTQTQLLDLDFQYDLVGNPTLIKDLTAISGFDEDTYPVYNRTVDLDDFYRVRNVQYGYGSMNGMATYRPAFKPEIDSADARPAARRNLATRPHEQHFDFDYMGNTVTTTDDLSARYDRSLGPVTNGDGTGWGPNQLTAAQGVSARYDESGNLVELKVERPGNCPSGMGSRCAQWYAYEWDEIGQLSRARRWDYASTLPAPAGDVPDETPTWDLRYEYSGGLRVLKTSKDALGTERHTLEVFGSLRFEHDEYIAAAGDYERHRSTTHVYLAGGAGHAFYDDSLPTPLGASYVRIYLNVGDHLGSTTAVIDHATSELVERSTYMAYGALESDHRPARWSHAREPYKFTGKEEDIEVGATYFGARYYNAHLGRFMSADPLTIHGLGADMNPYAYVGGRVMSHVDPLGLDDEEYDQKAQRSAAAARPAPPSYENFEPPPNSIPAQDNWQATRGYTPFLWFLGQVVNHTGELSLDTDVANPLNPWGAPSGTSFWIPTPQTVLTVMPGEHGSAGGSPSYASNQFQLPRADPAQFYPNAYRNAVSEAARVGLAELTMVVLTDGLSEMLAPRAVAGDGVVEFTLFERATPDQIAQARAYVRGSNEALEAGFLSPSGRVSTKGALQRDASRAAQAERVRAAAAGTPYRGHAGHVPDTTWSGQPEPFAWADLHPSVNTSLGGQAPRYPVGFRPTGFILKARKAR